MGVGEFIVGLQVVGLNIDRLRFGVAAEVDLRRRGGYRLPLPQQEGHGRGAGRVSLQGFPDGMAQRRNTVEVQQFEQSCLDLA